MRSSALRAFHQVDAPGSSDPAKVALSDDVLRRLTPEVLVIAVARAALLGLLIHRLRSLKLLGEVGAPARRHIPHLSTRPTAASMMPTISIPSGVDTSALVPSSTTNSTSGYLAAGNALVLLSLLRADAAVTNPHCS